MEGGKEMERLREQVLEHEKRIQDLELGGRDQKHQIELLSIEVKGMNAQFAELKAAVKEDGTKTRESIQKSDDQHTAASQRMTEFFMKQFETLQSNEEAAASFERETKRTKLQVFRDIVLALLGGSIVIQELVGWLAKSF